MSKQALDSAKLRGEMLGVLPRPGTLYEAVRERGSAAPRLIDERATSTKTR